MAKNQTQLASAIKGALSAIQKDGTYTKIISSWNNKAGGITNFQINPSVQ